MFGKKKKSKGGESLPLYPASKLSFATPSAASGAGRNAAEFLYIANDSHYLQLQTHPQSFKYLYHQAQS